MKLDLISLTAQRAYEVWYPPRKPAHLAAHRLGLHQFAAAYIGSDADVRFLEFGVHSGISMRQIAALFTNAAARFVGFDSFEGLPEQWGSLPPGFFSTDGQPPAIPDHRVSFIKGWFQNTLPEYMPRIKTEPHNVTLVHFDADLYSSTLFLLSSLWWHIPDYFFIMDEFMGCELAAMRNFVTAFPVEVEFLSRVDDHLGQPMKIFGRLRNTELVADKAE